MNVNDWLHAIAFLPLVIFVFLLTINLVIIAANFAGHKNFAKKVGRAIAPFASLFRLSPIPEFDRPQPKPINRK